MTIPLSPARGELWESGTQGQPPVDIRGTVVETPQGVRLKLVRNGSNSVLVGCRLVEYMSTTPAAWRSEPHHNVRHVTNDYNHGVAGVVDHRYAELNRTVKRGALFWIIVGGPAFVLASGTGITNRAPLASKVGTVPGMVIQTNHGSAKIGHAMQTQPTAGASTLAFIQLS